MGRVKALITKFFWCLPLKNIIVFESVPDVSDNSKAVFEEMIRRGMNKKYKMVWWLSKERASNEKIPNVCFFQANKHKLRHLIYLARAKVFICCNVFFNVDKQGQKQFYLSHGTPLKSVKSYYTIPPTIEYAFSAGEGIKDLYSDELHFEKTKIVSLGYPRNDELTKSKVNIKNCLCGDFEKVIVWYPTFRQHKVKEIGAKGNALPIIHDAEMANRLNEYAKDRKVLLVIKPHFAQDMSYVKDLHLSNIRFINDEFFVKHKLSSYQFVGNCDALITDYSSIYYDFTLCNKPIGLIWEDIEEYKQKPGLIDNYEFYAKGGEKIYTIENFERFIDRISKGIDVLKEERNEIKRITNYADDGQNSKRVVDFIVEQLEA